MSDDEDDNGWGHNERQEPSLVVKAAVDAYLGDLDVGRGFYAELDEEVAEMIADAARRAETNGRKTVQPRDL